MKKLLLTLTVLFAVFGLTACSSSSSSSSDTSTLSSMPDIDGITYYGDVPQNPEKVVSLSSTYTGYLVQLGFTPVGVTSYDKNNPVMQEYVEDAEEVSSEDLETLAALEPDVIVVGSTDENIDQLKDIAPVITVEYGVQDYLEILSTFGKIFDKEDEANEWLTSWETKTEEVAAELKEATGSDVTFTVMGLYEKEVYLFGDNWGRGGEIIYQEFGYSAPQSVIDDVFPTGYLSISQEVVANYAGDYIIVAAEDDTTGSSLYESDVWNAIPAVQNGHVIKVDANVFYFNDPISLEYELTTLRDGILEAAA